jgi:phage baseplate assembly protein W
MEVNFLGVGWTFPVDLDQNQVAVAKYEDAVRQSIRMILGTAKR